jgi:protein FAM50
MHVEDNAIAKAEARAAESRSLAAKKRKASSSFLSFGGGDDDDSSSSDDDDDATSSSSSSSTSSSSSSSCSSSSSTKTKPATAGASKHKRPKLCKNPDVDTSFLPDRDRRVKEERERSNLKKEYEKRQSQLKQQLLEITYSWWDGAGHRRTIQVPKGTTINHFLELVRIQLTEQFPEMKRLSSDNMMYIKEDLIIPGDYTFYDLIKTKARGKSGPLFHFDVHDDLRLGPIDTRIEKDESHPGKIIDRAWFERNKHIFPANRWEIYDPSIDYGSYTIHGSEVR